MLAEIAIGIVVPVAVYALIYHALIVAYRHDYVPAVASPSSARDKNESSPPVTRFVRSWCDEQEWSPLGRLVYFRRSGAFYFHEHEMLWLLAMVVKPKAKAKSSHATGSTRRHYEKQLHVSLRVTHATASNGSSGSSYRLLLAGGHMTRHIAVDSGTYQFIVLRVDSFRLFDQLRAKYKEENFNEGDDTWRIDAFVRKPRDNLTITCPLRVQIKSRGEKAKATTLLCAGLLYHGTDVRRLAEANATAVEQLNAERHAHLHWWIETNKHIGYDKIILCNNSMPDTAAFRSLLAKYEHFVELYQLAQIPRPAPPPHKNASDVVDY